MGGRKGGSDLEVTVGEELDDDGEEVGADGGVVLRLGVAAVHRDARQLIHQFHAHRVICAAHKHDSSVPRAPRYLRRRTSMAP